MRIKSIMAGLAILAAGSPAFALKYTDTDMLNGGNGVFVEYGTSVKSAGGIFDLTSVSPAYVPGTPVTDATVVFYLSDNNNGNGRNETVQFKLSSVLLQTLGPGNVVEPPPNAATPFTYTGLFGGANGATIEADIEADGKIAWSVSAASGGFYVLGGKLTVETGETSQTDNSIPTVPDAGSTSCLLGGACLALATLRRKFQP